MEFLPSAVHNLYQVRTTQHLYAKPNDNRDDRWKSTSRVQRYVVETKWDNLHLVYFSGYAMRTYLTSPFLLKLPKVPIEEIEPWREQGDVWCRLKVTFPPEIATHSTEQVF